MKNSTKCRVVSSALAGIMACSVMFAPTDSFLGQSGLSLDVNASAATVSEIFDSLEVGLPNLKYTEKNGEVTITGVKNWNKLALTKVSRVCIPDEVNGKPVTSIAAKAFMNTDFKGCTVIIPSTCKTIGEKAFDGAKMGRVIVQNVETSKNPIWGLFQKNDATVKIGKLAFGACFSLKTVEFNDVTPVFSYGSFQGCTALKDVFCNAKDVVIPEYCFYNCKALENCYPLEYATSVGKSAFYGSGLRAVYMFNEGTVAIGANAFASSSKLEEVTIASAKPTLNTQAFANCSKLSRVVFSDDPYAPTGANVAFGPKCFLNDKALREIYIGGANAAVSKAGSAVFSGCKNVVIYSDSASVATFANKQKVSRKSWSAEQQFADMHNLDYEYQVTAADCVYQGKAVKPSYTLKWRRKGDKTWQKANDFPDAKPIVEYTDNNAPGLGTITVRDPSSHRILVVDQFRIAPAAPTSVKAVSSTTGEIKLSWAAPKGCTSENTVYFIQQSTDGKTYSEPIVNNLTSTSYTIKNLEPGKKYYFKVTAGIVVAPEWLSSEDDMFDMMVTYVQGKTSSAASTTVLSGEWVMSNADVILNNSSAEYCILTWNKSAAKMKPSSLKVVLDGKTLTRNTDYTATFPSNPIAGKNDITIKGKGQYTGTTTVSYYVLPTVSNVAYNTKVNQLSWSSTSFNKNIMFKVTIKLKNGKSVTKGLEGTKGFYNLPKAYTGQVKVVTITPYIKGNQKILGKPVTKTFK